MRAMSGAPFWHDQARPDPALAKRRWRTPRTRAWSCLGHGVASQSWCSGFPVSSSSKPGFPPAPFQIRGNSYKTQHSGVWLEEDPPSPAIAPWRSPHFPTLPPGPGSDSEHLKSSISSNLTGSTRLAPAMLTSAGQTSRSFLSCPTMRPNDACPCQKDLQSFL